MRRSRPLLGTFVEITILEGCSSDAEGRGRALERAFDAVAEVQRLMSFHDQGSDLSAINAAPAGALLEVHAWTADVLRLALGLHEATDGAFDCGIGDVLVAMGELPDHGDRGRAGSMRGAPSIRDVEIIGERQVRLRHTTCMDLGGIAKGFAVDKAVEALMAHGISAAVVEAGGDLRVLGSDHQPVHVRSTGPVPSLRFLGSIADGAVATSETGTGSGERRCRGRLIDPRTRRMLRGRRTVTVLAPTCAVADGLTKALAVAGRLDPACLRRYGAIPVLA